MILSEKEFRIEDSDEGHFQIVAKLFALHLAGLRIRLIGVPFPCVCNSGLFGDGWKVSA